jgi:hypothetical protein
MHNAVFAAEVIVVLHEKRHEYVGNKYISFPLLDQNKRPIFKP